MARSPRIELAGGIHHVTAKTPSGRVLFHDDNDRRRYLELLARETGEREWRVLTYCQLTNHLHVLVQTPRPDLGHGFKRVHEEFARYVNRRHAQEGHVFGARFYSGLVSSDRHALGCLRYVARNPVEAGICRQPRGWPWSAHCSLAGLSEPPAFLDVGAAYEFLDTDQREARVAYLRLVARSHADLLADLARPDSDAWLVTAIDDFSIPIAEVAAFLGRALSTTYQRLAAARILE